MATTTKTPTRKQVLRIFATKGAPAAAAAAGVSQRTVQRWASAEGIASGFKPKRTVGHGTMTCYTRGCRRKMCVEAAAEYRREQKASRIRRWHAGEIEVTHGSHSTYVNYDCRCADCSAAWSKHCHDQRVARLATA